MRTVAFLCGFWLLSSAIVHADLYQWTDKNGIIHIVDEAGAVPEAYQKKVKVYRGTKTPVSESPSAAFLSPSRQYAIDSQGAFAQKLALDLRLISNDGQDALGPLSGVGIRPSGGWSVNDPLTPETLYDVLASARRAADARRISLSADAIEAVVQQAAGQFLSAPPVVSSSPETWQDESEDFLYEEPEIVIEHAPLEVVEVIHEPYYVPVMVGAPYFHGHRRRHRGHHDRRLGRDESRFSLGRERNRSIRRGISSRSFGTPNQPFGTPHMPFSAGAPARIRAGARR